MNRNNVACDSCSDTSPERRLLNIVVAVAVGIAAFSTASLVFAGSPANMRSPDKSTFDTIAR